MVVKRKEGGTGNNEGIRDLLSSLGFFDEYSFDKLREKYLKDEAVFKRAQQMDETLRKRGVDPTIPLRMTVDLAKDGAGSKALITLMENFEKIPAEKLNASLPFLLELWNRNTIPAEFSPWPKADLEKVISYLSEISKTASEETFKECLNLGNVGISEPARVSFGESEAIRFFS